jgi:2-methylcitrate dehydratase PrpD
VKNTFDILTAVSGLGAGVPVRRKWDIGASSVTGSVKGNRGVASVEGILAAWQAKHGFSGRTGLLDLDPRDWYLADLPVQGYEDLTKGLGETYRIMDVSFKPTPSCRWTHVPITAAWQALEDQPIKAQDISQIVIRGVERLKRYEWQTMLDAQFSIPCALALAITGAQPGPGWYTTGRFRDEDIRELASKVTYERDREAEALEIEQGKMVCEVNITLKDGQVKTAHADRIKGAPDNPMSRDEILAKFRANLSFADDVWIAKALDMVMNLGGVPDTTVLVEQLY